MEITFSKSSLSDSWFPLVLFLIFMTLKLTGFIAWSWWWVTAPLWVPLGFILSLIAIGCLTVVFIAILAIIAD